MSAVKLYMLAVHISSLHPLHNYGRYMPASSCTLTREQLINAKNNQKVLNILYKMISGAISTVLKLQILY